MTRKLYSAEIQRLLREDSGAALTDFAVLISLVSVALIGLNQAFGATIVEMHDDIAMILETINGLMTVGNDYIS